jgi:hypothetical protein
MSKMASVQIVFFLMLKQLISYRIEGKLPSQQELAFLESIVPDIDQPVRDLLYRCIEGLRALTPDLCRIEREKNTMAFLLQIHSLVRDGNHPDFERILQQIQMMMNSVGEYISLSQEATRDAFRRLLPCLDAYIRENDDFGEYQSELSTLTTYCAGVHQLIVRELLEFCTNMHRLEFCTNMPRLECRVGRLESVVTFLAKLLGIMHPCDDLIVVEFLQSLEQFHRDLEKSLESKRHDFKALIVEYAQILKTYVRTGIVDERMLLDFTRYDPDPYSYKAANARFVVSITGAPAYAPQYVSKPERIAFVREAIRQAFEMAKKISDFAPHPIPGFDDSYAMPYPVPGALQPLSDLRFSLLRVSSYQFAHAKCYALK